MVRLAFLAVAGQVEVLERIQGYLVGISEREARGEAFGPFTAYYSEITTEDWGWYALATGVPADGWAEPVAAVDDAFAARGRRVRFEFLHDLFPGLADELRDLGFTGGDVEPLLVLEELIPGVAVPGVEIVRLSPDEPALHSILEIAHEAFEEEGVVTERRVEEKRAELRQDPDKVMLAAVIDDEFVASGLVVRVDGVAEIAAIATRPPYRRRGIAAALTTELVRIGMDAGADLAYLTARDAPAARIYERLGFRKVGTYMELERPKA